MVRLIIEKSLFNLVFIASDINTYNVDFHRIEGDNPYILDEYIQKVYGIFRDTRFVIKQEINNEYYVLIVLDKDRDKVIDKDKFLTIIDCYLDSPRREFSRLKEYAYSHDFN